MRPAMDGPIVQASRLRKIYHGANEVEALRGIDLDVCVPMWPVGWLR